MSKNNTIHFVIFVFACLILCVIFTQLFISDCLWWDCAPTRNFSVLDLNIPPELSSGTSIHLLDDDNPSTKGTGVQPIYSNGLLDTGHYIVEKYSTVKKAAEAYKHGLHLFKVFETQQAWTTPKKLSFTSRFADESMIGCGVGFQKDFYRCIFQGRYEEILIIVNCRMSEDMTYQDFEKIVVFLDQKIATLLNK